MISLCCINKLKQGNKLKNIILVTLLLNTLLFSNDVFDISKIKLGKIKFETKTNMRIYKNKFITFNLPIKIHSHTEALKKTKTGYSRRSIVTISFTALKNNKMNMVTETLSEFDTKHRLTKTTQHINRNAEQQSIICTPLREEILNTSYQKELGYKSDVLLFNCDNNTQKKMQTNLQKTLTPGIANYTTKKHYIMIYNDKDYVIKETTKMAIDVNGTIKKISSNINIKDLFSIKYRTKDIQQ